MPIKDLKTAAIVGGVVALGVITAGLLMGEGKDLPVVGKWIGKAQNGFQGIL